MGIVLAAALAASAQDFSKLSVVKVSSDHRFTEGPAWSPEGYLIFSDIPNDKVQKWTPNQGTSVVREKSNGANGNAFDSQGRLYTCESRTRRVIRMNDEGKVEVLAERFEGKRLNAPNDIAVRKDGHAFFTDPAFGSQSDTRELGFFGVYHLTPGRELRVIARWKTRPNGVALAANGRTLYVTNADERNVRAWDLDRGGNATNERVVLSGIKGVPGGITLDEKGNLYVAAAGVAIYSPDGKLLYSIDTSETPSNVTFGDADTQTLFITARTSVYGVRLDVKGAVQH